MGMRVRGKATARPNEVGDPSLRVRNWCLPGTGIPRRKKSDAAGVPNPAGRCFGPERGPNDGWNRVVVGKNVSAPLRFGPRPPRQAVVAR